MVVKINQLKKFNLKELKAIVKKHKLGKITKRKKAQLIGMISNCETCKVILSTLSIPIRAKRKATPAQIRARKEFGERMRKSKKVPQVLNEAKQKAIKEMKDNLKEPQRKELTFGNGIKVQGVPVFKPKEPVIKKKEIVETIKEEIKAPVKLIEKIADIAEELISKKQFLDDIFGVSVFNFQEMLTDILNEVEDEGKIMMLMSKSKKELKQFLMKAFENADSMAEIINSI